MTLPEALREFSVVAGVVFACSLFVQKTAGSPLRGFFRMIDCAGMGLGFGALFVTIDLFTASSPWVRYLVAVAVYMAIQMPLSFLAVRLQKRAGLEKNS